MPSVLNIRLRDLYDGYETSLLICAIRHVSKVPVTLHPDEPAHLEIRGPFKHSIGRWARAVNKVREASVARTLIKPREGRARVVLYHTEENTRYNTEDCDFSISSDLGVESETHFRMPNWWCCVHWADWGVENLPSPRIRNLAELKTLLNPLGEQVLLRKKKAAFFTSHVREPRESIFRALSSIMEVDGYGSYFDREARNHNSSGYYKDDILKSYMFSLCPENSMYPGYYTEKIPESFAAGCIPITWADQNIAVDFNPKAIVNLANFASVGYCVGLLEQLRADNLRTLVGTPLLSKIPDFKVPRESCRARWRNGSFIVRTANSKDKARCQQ